MKELFHFLRHAPATLVEKSRLSQREIYDVVMDRADEAGLARERAALVGDVRGDVLEIGCGTGHMFAHYPEGARVTGLELDADFAEAARRRAKKEDVRAKIDVVLGDGGALPVPDASFDVVVSSLVLCSVDEPAKVLAEIKRVLRPGGEVRLIEHVRSPRPVAGVLMDVANPIWLFLNGQGCRLNRRTEQTLREQGFSLDDIVPFQVFSAGLPAFPMRRMIARPH